MVAMIIVERKSSPIPFATFPMTFAVAGRYDDLIGDVRQGYVADLAPRRGA